MSSKQFEHYSYIYEFKSEIAEEIELYYAVQSYRADLRNNNIDVELIDPIKSLLQSNILIPCFSCTGHNIDRGYISFRSFLSVVDTLNLVFKPILRKFDSEPNVDVSIHYWNDNAIGYILHFDPCCQKDILNYLILILNTLNSKTKL